MHANSLAFVPLLNLNLPPPPPPPPFSSPHIFLSHPLYPSSAPQLKKLFEKYQGKKAEVGDLQEQFQREREGMLEDYRILTQQIKLKNLIIACFIPPDYQDKVRAFACVCVCVCMCVRACVCGFGYAI
jgi:hypothetical protein